MITQDDIIYFIVTDRFFDGDANNNLNADKTNPAFRHGGDLKGIENKFDYLVKLGITAIWITPVYLNIAGFSNAQPYHYYWPKDFSVIDDHLYSNTGAHPAGDKKYLKDFVDNCHARGLKVILDVVVNHTGYDNGQPVFPPDWYRNQPPDPDFSGLPKLDLANATVVDFFVNNLLDWIEISGIDGLRMDMARNIGGYTNHPDNPVTDPDFNKFWYYYKSIVKGKFPQIFIVGEVFDSSFTDVDQNATFQNQSDLNSIFDFPLRERIKNVIIYDHPFYEIARPRLNIAETAGILDLDDPSNGGYYTNANRLVTLLDNHDLDRRIMSEIRTRHTGDENKSFCFQVAVMMYAFLFTVRGIPQIYYGSETGLEGYKNNNGSNDYDLRRDFPWNLISAHNEVSANFADESTLHQAIKKLIIFRKSSAALRYGVTITLWVDNFVYSFLRYFRDEIVIVVFNNGYLPMQFPLEITIKKSAFKDGQTLPDRIVDLLSITPLTNVFNIAETVQVANEKFSISVDGKSFKIMST
ncbi:MAG TPA: alpha-amylase family glycosyl hydrolase [Puia sp.]